LPDHLRNNDLVVLSRFILPENGPGDAIAPQFGHVSCAAAAFRIEEDTAINDAEIRFRHRGPAPTIVVRYVGLVDEVGRLLSTIQPSVRQPESNGDIVYAPGTFRLVLWE
jgi:hypothetical protein